MNDKEIRRLAKKYKNVGLFDCERGLCPCCCAHCLAQEDRSDWETWYEERAPFRVRH